MRTGLVVLVPEADNLLTQARSLAPLSVGCAMPAHVTVLFPFKNWEALDAEALARLGAIYGEASPFELTFQRVGRFPGVLWLAPDPRARIDDLTRRTVEAFPDHPPYGGRFGDPTPHLTLAEGDEAAIARADWTVRARLTTPIRTRVAECVLFGLAAHAWRPMRRFALGGA